jgi:hypothetical protein
MKTLKTRSLISSLMSLMATLAAVVVARLPAVLAPVS